MPQPGPAPRPARPITQWYATREPAHLLALPSLYQQCFSSLRDGLYQEGTQHLESPMMDNLHNEYRPGISLDSSLNMDTTSSPHGYPAAQHLVSLIAIAIGTPCSPVAACQLHVVTFCVMWFPPTHPLSVSTGSPRPLQQSGATLHSICSSPSGWPHSIHLPGSHLQTGSVLWHSHPWISSSQLPSTPSHRQFVLLNF